MKTKTTDYRAGITEIRIRTCAENLGDPTESEIAEYERIAREALAQAFPGVAIDFYSADHPDAPIQDVDALGDFDAPDDVGDIEDETRRILGIVWETGAFWGA